VAHCPPKYSYNNNQFNNLAHVEALATAQAVTGSAPLMDVELNEQALDTSGRMNADAYSLGCH